MPWDSPRTTGNNSVLTEHWDGITWSVSPAPSGRSGVTRHDWVRCTRGWALTGQRSPAAVSGAALLDEEDHEADHHFLDPFVALGAAAAVTTPIKLGTGICTALIYDPVILAMQVSTLDQLSAGRFLFGIGVGHEDTVHNHGSARNCVTGCCGRRCGR